MRSTTEGELTNPNQYNEETMRVLPSRSKKVYTTPFSLKNNNLIYVRDTFWLSLLVEQIIFAFTLPTPNPQHTSPIILLNATHLVERDTKYVRNSLF